MLFNNKKYNVLSWSVFAQTCGWILITLLILNGHTFLSVLKKKLLYKLKKTFVH